MNQTRSMAYKEVYEILRRTKKEYVNRIPNSFKSYILDNMDKEYNPNINSKLDLKDQNLCKETYAILAMINLNFVCKDELKKEELKKIYKQNSIKQQEKLRKKYNPNNIFGNQINSITKVNNEVIVIPKKTLLVKIKNKLKSIFNK